MSAFSLLSVLLVLAALFGVLNHWTVKLPNTIGVLVIALAVSIAMLVADPLIPAISLRRLAQHALGTVDLPQTLLSSVLSFLLFAGALEVDLDELRRRIASVLSLALLGTLLAVAILAVSTWLIFYAIGLPVPLAWCVVLGTILAPTDPIAVVGMLRRIGLPGGVQAIFAGESLFNDGVAVVVFGAAVGFATGRGGMGDLGAVAVRFIVEAFGGAAIGLVTGAIAFAFLKRTHARNLEVTITLALATGTYTLANGLHTSGPIAVVIAGLWIGSNRVQSSMSVQTRHEMHTFWSLIDEVLNSLLFLLIGFEVVALPFNAREFVAASCAIPVMLATRAISVSIPTIPLHLGSDARLGTLIVLTWGGLRGGISVALALSLPNGPERAALLTVCYVIVVFTIVVQGLTVERVARRYFTVEDATEDA